MQPAQLALFSNLDLPSISLVVIFVIEILAGVFLIVLWRKLIQINSTFSQLSKQTFVKLKSVHDEASKLDENMVGLAGKELEEYVKQLPDLSKQFAEKHQEALIKIGRQESKSITKEQDAYIKILVSETRKSIDSFNKHLDTLMEQIKQDLKTNLTSQVKNHQQELSQEKSTQMEKQVNRLVQKIAKKVLHKNLSIQDHHDYVIKQIHSAWEKGVFK